MQRIQSILVMLFLVLLRKTQHAQANYMGSFIVDPYYGAPNLDRLLWDTPRECKQCNRLQKQGFGPFGIRR